MSNNTNINNMNNTNNTNNTNNNHLAVDIQNVSFRYTADRPILQDVSMQFPKGKLIAVMGGSGSGKTTLLRLIGKQVIADKGNVLVENNGSLHDMKKVSGQKLYDIRRNMGCLFQFGALFTDLNVFDNVAFPLREHTDLSESMIKDLVLMKLNAVGLRGANQLKTNEISGGMARRVALARAIALDPSIILYDEPFAGLDPISLGITAQLIKEVNNALGATSILVTHDIEESFAIVDYAYVMMQGKVIAHGTPAELKESDNEFVRQFIYGKPDGPLPFHYPAMTYEEDLGLKS